MAESQATFRLSRDGEMYPELLSVFYEEVTMTFQFLYSFL